MAFLEKKYAVSTDQYGLAVIEIRGRCTEDEKEDIEGDCTRRFEMVALPNASGAILKALDGTSPAVVEIEPSTFGGAVFDCVKIDGRVNPFAYKQTAGPYAGRYILEFVMTYQQVGGVA